MDVDVENDKRGRVVANVEPQNAVPPLANRAMPFDSNKLICHRATLLEPVNPTTRKAGKGHLLDWFF